MDDLELPVFFTVPAADQRPPASTDGLPNVTARTPPGFSMIFDRTFRPADACNAFMYDKTAAGWSTGLAWRKANTQRSLADDLTQFLTWCEAVGRSWETLTQADLSDYANAMARTISFVTNRQLSYATRKRRVGSVVSFLRWTILKGYRVPPMADSPASTEAKPREKPPVGHFVTSEIKVNRHNDETKEPDPHPIDPSRMTGIFDRLGGPLFERNGDLARVAASVSPRRNRLAAETAYHTGMRVSEVAGMRLSDIEKLSCSLQGASPWQPFLIKVPTKGGGARKVAVPALILRALIAYARTERAAAVSKARRLAKENGLRFTDHGRIFVNGLGSSDRDVGRPARPQVISAAFSEAVIAEGLVTTERGFVLDEGTGDPVLGASGLPLRQVVVRARHTFHDLRHSFAVLLYRSEVARGNSEPWERVRERLGHASVQTTMDTYLHHVGLDEAELSDRLAFQLRMDLDALR